MFFSGKLLDFIVGFLLVGGVITAFVTSISVMPELYWRDIAQSSALHKEAAITLREREEVADRLQDHRTTFDALMTRADPDTNLQIKLQSLSKTIQAETTQLATIDGALTAFGLNSAAKAAVSDLQLARHSWRWRHFAQATPGQLVLLVTLLMGALGGIIAVARAFVTPEETDRPRFSDCFIRPLMGAVIAFVIYMAIQVGQIMLTAAGDAAPLNPYPIALAAVVSGMMAAQAIAAVERWGTRLFERIGGMPIGSSLAEMDGALAHERRRLEGLKKKLAGNVAQTAQAALTSAKAAHDEALKDLTAAQGAIDRLSADQDDEALIATASAALLQLRAKAKEAERLANALPTP